LARAITGRIKYLKFEGHYHGWSDQALVSYHPTHAQLSPNPVPVGAGQLPHNYVVIAEWNSREQVEAAFARHAGEISAILCEPLLANSGCIPPEPGFLEFLRETANQHSAMLIFDEVITGFRIDLQGAQGRFGVVPDLATYAKAVGAGTALSVLAGKAEFMAPIVRGEVVHAGTLNGNCIALAAAKAAITVLSDNDGAVYPVLRARSQRLRDGIAGIFKAAGVPVTLSGDGPVFQLSFLEQPAVNYRDTIAANAKMYSDFAIGLLDEGILVLPDGRWYVSTAHTDADIDRALESIETVVKS
jgi:glutamate-1-semialdehyde 2,1-aminomutase